MSTQHEVSTIPGGTIILITSATGFGGKRYRVECSGRDLYALRDESGACKTKRYTLAELHAKQAAGLLRTLGE